MSYQVLARRLRPKGFDALVGQDHVVRALRNGLDSGRVHHAYLFTGTRGVGKTTIARILAKCLNCESGVSSTPCGICSICREVEENRFMDLIEVDAASRTKVDDTRELLDNAQYRPSRGRFKVYLIDEVHMLSASSFNAFLKTLEEPPEHVKFLLATTDPKKVPVTVLSRCLQFQLKNIGREEIARYVGEVLTEEGIDYEPDAVRIIAKSARGSMRDALSITDQAIAYGGGSLAAPDVAAMVGVAGRDETGAVIAALASGDPRRILELSAALADKAADFHSVLAELLEALHGMAVDQALGETSDGGLGPEAVQLYYQIALIGYRDLFIGPDPKTGFEMTLLRMLAFAPDADAAASVPPGAAESGSGAPSAPKSTEARATPTTATTPTVPSTTTPPSKPAQAQAESAPTASMKSGAQNYEGAEKSPGPSNDQVDPTNAKPPRAQDAPKLPEPSNDWIDSPIAGIKPSNAEIKPPNIKVDPPNDKANPPSLEAGPPTHQARLLDIEADSPKGGTNTPNSAANPPNPASGPPTHQARLLDIEADSPKGEANTPHSAAHSPNPASGPPTHQARPPDIEADSPKYGTNTPHSAANPSNNGVGGRYEEWYELVGRMDLEGIDRTIVERSLLVERAGGVWRLLLDRKHASLLSATETVGIERALAEVLGESVQLAIELGDPQVETPAERNDRLFQERMAAERRRLEEDPTVRSLLDVFDGQLESVRLLDMKNAI